MKKTSPFAPQLTSSEQLRIHKAVAELLIARLGGPEKAKLVGTGSKPYFLETYVRYPGRPWDGHKSASSILKFIALVLNLLDDKTEFEEIVVCLNERDPVDLVDEFGLTYADIQTAIAPLPNFPLAA